MTQKKLKCYVLILSRYFPKSHKRAGEPTRFFESIEAGTKIHTIRENYELWKKRIDEVNAGEAYISRRYWSGDPYNSNQVEYDRIYRAGIEKEMLAQLVIGSNSDQYSKNDGLNYDDFFNWFKKLTINKKMAIIHFTDFRYASCTPTLTAKTNAVSSA